MNPFDWLSPRGSCYLFIAIFAAYYGSVGYHAATQGDAFGAWLSAGALSFIAVFAFLTTYVSTP